MSITGPVSHNQVSVGLTAVQLNATKRPLLRGMLISSLAANTAIIYVGSSSNVTTGNGFPIAIGGGILWPEQEQSAVWCISGSAAQTVAFAAG